MMFRFLILLITLNLTSSVQAFNSYKAKHGEFAIIPISQEERVKLSSQSSCYQFQVAQGDCYESKEWSDCNTFRERAELIDYRSAPLNEKIQYKLSLMLPFGYPRFEVKQIIGQWHNDVYGPTLSIRHLNGSVWLDLMLQKNRTTHKFPLKDMVHGLWYTYTLEVIWSHGKEGRIKLWNNGKKEVEYAGPTLDPKLKKAPYFRFGLYRSHLYRMKRSSWPTQSIFYCDISSSF